MDNLKFSNMLTDSVVNTLNLAKTHFKSNPNVSKMAGKMNGVDGHVILNPKYNKESVIKNERHYFDETNFQLPQEQINYINGHNIPTFKKGSIVKTKKKNSNVITFNLNKLLKYQTGDSIKRIDFNGLKNDPEYKKNFNWKMYDKDLEILQDSLIARGADIPETIAVFSQVIPESGGSPKPHGNGAYGLIGFRESRAENLPEDTPGQVHVLMNAMYNNPKAKDWTHGGKGTGVQTGKEMMNLFLNTSNILQAVKAYMKGFVRPEKLQWEERILFSNLLKKYMK